MFQSGTHVALQHLFAEIREVRSSPRPDSMENLQVAAKAEARLTKRFEQAAHEAAESAKQVHKLEQQVGHLKAEHAAAEEESEDLMSQVHAFKI